MEKLPTAEVCFPLVLRNERSHISILYSVVCFDAKVNFDDNAEFRQKDIFAMDDQSETDPKEIEATRHNLNYIAMDGNIACLGELRENRGLVGRTLI